MLPNLRTFFGIILSLNIADDACHDALPSFSPIEICHENANRSPYEKILRYPKILANRNLTLKSAFIAQKYL